MRAQALAAPLLNWLSGSLVALARLREMGAKAQGGPAQPAELPASPSLVSKSAQPAVCLNKTIAT